MNKASLTKALVNAKKDVTINKTNLSRCMIRQPSLFLKYATIGHRALVDQKRLKMMLERREAYLHRMLAEEHSRVTEKMLTAKCWDDKEYCKVRKMLVRATTSVYIMEQVCRAFEHRRDMLINVGASVREEMRSLGLSTKKGDT